MNEAKTSFLAHYEANSYLLEIWLKRLGHLNANNIKNCVDHGKGHGHASGVECRAFVCMQKTTSKASKQGDCFAQRKHLGHQNLGACAFQHLRADEHAIHQRRKVVSHIHW